ncbi:MAG: universal stress protein [Sneathiella sp.]|nr:universal stress protein [Sneathiella sp.]
MSAKIVVGMDGSESSGRVTDFAKGLAKLIGDCELILVYVVEWSPYTFQTPEENEIRHKRREEEIQTALERVLNPAVDNLKQEGFSARGVVKHGKVAALLDLVAVEEKAHQIVVARSSEGGIAKTLFGSSTAHLMMNASVPVTVIK